MIFLVATSIELNFRSNDTTLNQKVFEWGDLGLIINDGSVGNNYFFIDGTGHRNKRIQIPFNFSDGNYHTLLLSKASNHGVKHLGNGVLDIDTSTPYSTIVAAYVDGVIRQPGIRRLERLLVNQL